MLVFLAGAFRFKLHVIRFELSVFQLELSVIQVRLSVVQLELSVVRLEISVVRFELSVQSGTFQRNFEKSRFSFPPNPLINKRYRRLRSLQLEFDSAQFLQREFLFFMIIGLMFVFNLMAKLMGSEIGMDDHYHA